LRQYPREQSEIMNPWIAAVAALIVSLVSIFFVLMFTRRFGLFDPVEARKVHTGNVPRLGGIGIILGFVAGLVVYTLVSGGSFDFRVWALILGSALVFVMGVWDDLKPWRARVKLLVQVAAALTVIAAGYVFKTLRIAGLGTPVELGWFGYVLTFCWIIGVTNAVNLIDGIDGLAGTVSVLAALTFAYIFRLGGNGDALMICLILAVSISGFLAYNLPLPRAKIFMGDGGSQFLGFILAVLPLIPGRDGRVGVNVLFAAAVLMIPIFDTIAALWRRTREGRSFFEPDKFHLHHKLMMLGFSSRQSLFILFLFQALISVLVLIASRTRGLTALASLASVYLLGTLFFTVVHVRKEEILEKSKLL